MRRSEEERRQREREERSRRRPADGWRYEDDRPPRSRGAYDDDGWEDVRSEIRGNFADDFSPGYREGESWEDRPHVPEDDWVEADRPGHAAAPRRHLPLIQPNLAAMHAVLRAVQSVLVKLGRIEQRF